MKLTFSFTGWEQIKLREKDYKLILSSTTVFKKLIVIPPFFVPSFLISGLGLGRMKRSIHYVRPELHSFSPYFGFAGLFAWDYSFDRMTAVAKLIRCCRIFPIEKENYVSQRERRNRYALDTYYHLSVGIGRHHFLWARRREIDHVLAPMYTYNVTYINTINCKDYLTLSRIRLPENLFSRNHNSRKTEISKY